MNDQHHIFTVFKSKIVMLINGTKTINKMKQANISDINYHRVIRNFNQSIIKTKSLLFNFNSYAQTIEFTCGLNRLPVLKPHITKLQSSNSRKQTT